MAITPLPIPVPTTADPANFDARADAFLSALPDFATEANALAATVNLAEAAATLAAGAASASAAAAVGSTAYAASSSSSHSLTAGSKAFVLNESGKAFAVGDQVLAGRRSDPEARMSMVLTAVAGTTITGTVSVGSIVGSGGPYTDWVIILALFAVPGTAAADIIAGTSTLLAVTPAASTAALAEITLADTSTIAVDMSTFINAKVTLGGNRTLGNPTNTKDGQTGHIRIIQDGTGSRTLSFGSNWKREGGALPVSTPAGSIDIIEFEVISSTYIFYDIARAPS